MIMIIIPLFRSASDQLKVLIKVSNSPEYLDLYLGPFLSSLINQTHSISGSFLKSLPRFFILFVCIFFHFFLCVANFDLSFSDSFFFGLFLLELGKVISSLFWG